MNQNEELSNRLRKNYKKLKKFLNKNKIEAYRLYDRDLPNIPYIIDIYGENAIIFERGKKDQEDLPEKQKQSQEAISQSIELVMDIPKAHHFFKQRFIQDKTSKYSKLSVESKKAIVHEGNLSFHVNLTDYLDAGLFLDHRPLRMKLGQEFTNKKCLNLFCYTSSLSVALAKAQNKVTSVDLSQTYINWSKDNFVLNDINLSDHRFCTVDCIDFLKRESLQYDLIILDPPSFSISKKTNYIFDIQKIQLELIELCMSRLEENGLLIFSNNLTSFKLSPEIKEKYDVKNTTHQTIPIDFRNKKIHQSFEIRKKA